MTAKLSETSAFKIVKKQGDKYAPQPLYNFTKSVLELRYLPGNIYREKVAYPLYKKGVLGFDNLYTDTYYEKRKVQQERLELAEEFAETITDFFNPESVLDVGCAIGHFLKPLKQREVEIQGVDAHSSCLEHSVVPEEQIDIQDLTQGYDPGKSFDLVMCLEVLEHIPEKHSDEIVEMITDSGNYLVISAATPGQGGDHHVNEQPKQYWIDFFESKGVVYQQELTQSFKESVSMSDVRVENLLIFNSKRLQP